MQAHDVRAGTLILLALTLTLAGCIGTDGDAADEGDGLAANAAAKDAHGRLGAMAPVGAEAMPGFSMDLSGCLEAIGVSVYNSEKGAVNPVEPFLAADISEDTGNPAFGSYMVPITSEHTTGIWHAAGTCDKATINGETVESFDYGWVGVRVEPPPWDDGTVTRQYFVPDLSFGAWDLVETLRENGRIHATRMLSGGASWVAPDTARALMDDEVHGVFESYAVVDQAHSMAEMDATTVRFWMLVPANGMMLEEAVAHGHGDEEEEDTGGVVEAHDTKFRPVAIDLVNTDGTFHIARQGAATSHTRTNHHGAAGGAQGNVAGVVLSDFDRTIQLGPTPDVLLDATWLH